MDLRNEHRLKILELAAKKGLDPKKITFRKVPSLLKAKFFSTFNILGSGNEKISIRYDRHYTFEIMTSLGRYIAAEEGWKINLTASFYPGIKFLHAGMKYEIHESQLNVNDILSEWGNHWLNAIKRELDTANKIERLINIPILSEDQSTEQHFTESEKMMIKSGINDLKDGIKIEFDLTDYKLDLINKKMDDLLEKVDQLNRFDFKSAFYGLMINLTSSVLYDNSGNFWEMIKSIFPSKLKIG